MLISPEIFNHMGNPDIEKIQSKKKYFQLLSSIAYQRFTCQDFLFSNISQSL